MWGYIRFQVSVEGRYETYSVVLRYPELLSLLSSTRALFFKIYRLGTVIPLKSILM